MQGVWTCRISKKRDYCVYCKKTGHIVSECRIKPPKNDNSKQNPKDYQALSEDLKTEVKPKISQADRGQVQLTDEVKQLVQNTVTSAISSAFSIGLSGLIFVRL